MRCSGRTDGASIERRAGRGGAGGAPGQRSRLPRRLGGFDGGEPQASGDSFLGWRLASTRPGHVGSRLARPRGLCTPTIAEVHRTFVQGRETDRHLPSGVRLTLAVMALATARWTCTPYSTWDVHRLVAGPGVSLPTATGLARRGEPHPGGGRRLLAPGGGAAPPASAGG